MTDRPMYRATAVQDGRWWAITIHNLPPHLVGVTQSAVDMGWVEAEAMTRECIGLLLDIPEDTFDVELKEEGDTA